ncbi:Inner membrane protein YrbG [Limihaloglobus sulfuriphilus]|uniref:Inner membrane protein YrbG n=1 Tax=Limihaloglobus sulfuriphilus TaxID=1851148 RepID=A0A1Q2MAT4_9BACT|nr:calcium/sodium antiporter [Limihaloglobus sulfuriphilus]AQQ69835.1 Inner membrane protein YrbG [Limihaloglobus sulfuriphilus]
MQILIWSAVFIAGLVFLLFFSDRFVVSAEVIGLRLNVPSFVLGVLVLAVGTSLPELFTSVISVLRGAPEIVSGTIIGSNIANILLVLGASALFAGKKSVAFNLKHSDIVFFLASALIFILVSSDGRITLPGGVILLLALAGYVGYVLTTNMPTVSDQPGESLVQASIMLAVSILGVYAGSEMLVRSVVKLSVIAGIPSEIIAASAVAFGTSVPELAVSLAAARRGNIAMSVGNVVGSNIFNVLGVAGFASLFGVITVEQVTLSLAVPVMAAATAAFAIVSFFKHTSRWQGALFVLAYLAFCAKLYGLF